MAKHKDLTEGPILSRIILFALPLIATAVLQQLFNTADTIVVGRWGGDTPKESEIALAAVGACAPLINLIINLFFGMSVGAGVCVAHDIGAKRYDDVGRVVHTSVLASLICGTAVMLFGLFASRPLLILMKTDASVLDQAVPYMCAYFCGVPANMLYNYCASMLRSSGDTARPLAFLSVAGAVNVLLNLIMVLVFRAGALGVGIATAVSQWVSATLIVGYMMRYDGICRISPKLLRINFAKLKKIVAIGLPAGLQGTLFSFSNVIIQSSINSFGSPAIVAGNTAASNVEAYIYATQNALSQTTLTFVGQNAGARRFDRVKRCVLWSTLVITVIGSILGGIAILLGEQLLGIFIPGNAEAIDRGMIRLTIFCATHFICGIMETGCFSMRGLGRSFAPMIVSLLGSCVFRIIWVYTVFAAFPTLTVLFVSYPISWAMTALVHYLMLFFALRKEQVLASG